MYELITTPFAWYNQTCSIPHQVLYLAVSTHIFTYKDHTRQISGTGLHQCKPYHDKLCYIPRFSGDTLQGPECARRLYQGATVEEISHHCPMSCHTSTATTISEIQEELYVITNPKNDAKIICDKITTHLSGEVHQKQGAIKIRLPCNCELHMNDEITIPKRFPCAVKNPSQANIIHTIPATWSNLK